ncbi:hypothetical protein [Miniphocaeibacter halophilus]|uniref:Uncharacterized protein n=1 Tax=Miniphocaeibacter halophilus TaxID=2931922 RepID=A0AC61MTV1_9FIRM|nr:hypothetical protein [Miniphocaeibacter halophilus]QQK08991.1 hypothetical protein JFY71_05490 [Miniphocaeibacter halophilus]
MFFLVAIQKTIIQAQKNQLKKKKIKIVDLLNNRVIKEIREEDKDFSKITIFFEKLKDAINEEEYESLEEDIDSVKDAFSPSKIPEGSTEYLEFKFYQSKTETVLGKNDDKMLNTKNVILYKDSPYISMKILDTFESNLKISQEDYDYLIELAS